MLERLMSAPFFLRWLRQGMTALARCAERECLFACSMDEPKMVPEL